jgi:hypothetical protein
MDGCFFGNKDMFRPAPGLEKVGGHLPTQGGDEAQFNRLSTQKYA